jgi:hypothetical protein
MRTTVAPSASIVWCELALYASIANVPPHFYYATTSTLPHHCYVVCLEPHFLYASCYNFFFNNNNFSMPSFLAHNFVVNCLVKMSLNNSSSIPNICFFVFKKQTIP